jgi:hypothetical protein
MRDVKAIRLGLLAVGAVASVLVASTVIRYPDVLDGGLDTAFYLAVLAVGLTVTVAAALVGTRLGGRSWRGAMRYGCRWGLLFGGLWVVEMVIANLGYGLGDWTVVPYFAATWAVWLLTAYAGAAAASRYRQVWAGTLVGAWSGLVGGLTGLITMRLASSTWVQAYRRSMDTIDACTLPTAEQPLRLAEFDDLFATAVRGVHRKDPTRVRLDLTPEPAVAARAADLAVRETRCCSFFTFTLAASGGQLSLDIAVPAERADVLAALAARAGTS